MNPDAAFFPARWGRAVRMITGIALLISAALPVIVLSRANLRAAVLVAIIDWAIIIGTLLFAVRGYSITATHLVILRVGWETRFSLEEIRECRADPEAMNGAIRLMGSGGLFAIAGIFRNRRLGTFRAYATEPENAVVISTSDKTLVITPADPRLFISALLDAKRPPER